MCVRERERECVCVCVLGMGAKLSGFRGAQTEMGTEDHSAVREILCGEGGAGGAHAAVFESAIAFGNGE